MIICAVIIIVLLICVVESLGTINKNLCELRQRLK